VTISTSTLRPGLLVSLKTGLRGNVNYRTVEVEALHVTDDGAERAKWETERVIADPVEHEAATKARSKIRTIITSVCAHSAFGLLCPEAEAENLERAIAEARRVADTFNATAKLTRVSCYVMTGRIAPDDVEAVKAINSEVRDLLSDMADGIAKLDVKVVRDAASRAKGLGEMLSPDAQARIQIAIDAARNSAKQIVKAGEQAAQEIDTAAIRKITEARTAFLDIGEATEVQAPVAESGRGLDLVPEGYDDDFAMGVSAIAPAIELGD
jgi:hypothetical protein